jgi:outer membrane protein
MNKLLLACLLVFAPVSLASADIKVAVVDLGKAFEQYYETKDAQARIHEKELANQKEFQGLEADYQHMGDDAKKLYDESNDATLSAAARADKTAAFDAKKKDLQAMQAKLQEMATEKNNEIKDELLRRHQEIVGKITKIINDYSSQQGFDLVIDKSSASMASQVPIVLYNSSKLIDITPDIIKQLNASAPAGGAASGGAASTVAPPAVPASH